MNVPRYLPATHATVGGLRLGAVGVRTSDDRELGTLVGFVVDPQSQRVSSLVLEVVDRVGLQQVDLPGATVCFDAGRHALRFIAFNGAFNGDFHGLVDEEVDAPPGGPEVIAMRPFRPESVSLLDEYDLWVPLFHAA